MAFGLGAAISAARAEQAPSADPASKSAAGWTSDGGGAPARPASSPTKRPHFAAAKNTSRAAPVTFQKPPPTSRPRYASCSPARSTSGTCAAVRPRPDRSYSNVQGTRSIPSSPALDRRLIRYGQWRTPGSVQALVAAPLPGTSGSAAARPNTLQVIFWRAELGAYADWSKDGKSGAVTAVPRVL